MRPSLLVVVLAWSPLAVAEECEEFETAAAVESWLAAAEIHYSALNRAGFVESVDRASASLLCVQEAFSSSRAARFHRVTGLRSALEGDSVNARLSFAAARSITPDFEFPEDLLPGDHPFMELYLAIPVEDPATELVPAPRSGYLQFDGRHGLDRPVSWPTVFQLFAPTGEVLSTRLLQPSTPLPEYTRAGAGESASIVDKLVEETSSRRLSKPLFAIAAGTIMASAALYGTSALSAKRYWGEEDSENWDRYRLQTNGLFVASTATAAVGITVGAWALITVEF